MVLSAGETNFINCLQRCFKCLHLKNIVTVLLILFHNLVFTNFPRVIFIFILRTAENYVWTFMLLYYSHETRPRNYASAAKDFL